MNTANHNDILSIKNRDRKSWLPLTMFAKPALRMQPAASSKRPIRVLLVDDHPVVLFGIRSSLSCYDTVKVVGQATNGQDAVRQAKELMPDVVVMDINMPQMGGFEALGRLQSEVPGLKVLILTFYDSPEYLLRMLRSGARGYVVKNASPEDLLMAIETVYAGDTFFSSHLSHGALKRMALGNGEAPQASDLSNREQEILVAISEGFSNKEIAARLGIAVRTVETHRERMMRKLGIHTIAGLTQFAVKAGIVALPMEPQSVS